MWSGTPSQWLNFGAYLVSAIVAAAFVTGAFVWGKPVIAAGAALPVIYAFIKWLRVRTTLIEVTTERISIRMGAFSRRKWEMELYRVKDTTLVEPFLLRLVGRANIQIDSSDRTTPSLRLSGIRDAEALRQKIRASVERLRTARGVREMDMDIER